MSGAPAKFNFDLDLGHRQERNSVLTESAMAALVANARADGWQEGFREGERGATVRAAEALAAAATAIADHAAALQQDVAVLAGIAIGDLEAAVPDRGRPCVKLDRRKAATRRFPGFPGDEHIAVSHHARAGEGGRQRAVAGQPTLRVFGGRFIPFEPSFTRPQSGRR